MIHKKWHLDNDMPRGGVIGGGAEVMVEAELSYTSSEGYLRTGEAVALNGLLVVEEVGVVHIVAVET